MEEIFSVSEVNETARAILEEHFGTILVEGEISNLTCHRSGHWYFSLKDSQSQVDCAMFRGANARVKFRPEAGMHVQVMADVSLYEARGRFQLIITQMREVGEGALQRQFEKLKAKLEKEGLFEEAHKQALPDIPKTIGLITSPTGAAVRDVLSTLRRRFPGLPVILYPAIVQGEAGADSLCEAIATANRRRECDVLLLTRGGGSLEDLWCFNEEVVARAIFQSELPIISGVGHEVDVTIADLVADLRAPTPTAAAEIISPDKSNLLQQLAKGQKQLAATMRQALRYRQKHFATVARQLKHPKRRIEMQAQSLDEHFTALQKAWRDYIAAQTRSVADCRKSLITHSPKHTLLAAASELANSRGALTQHWQHYLACKQKAFLGLTRTLEAVSPLAVLARGYSILTDSASGEIIKSHKDTQVGQQVTAKLAEGTVCCEIKSLR